MAAARNLSVMASVLDYKGIQKASQDLALLLEQPPAFLRLMQLLRVGLGDAGLQAVFNLRNLPPAMQARLQEPKVLAIWLLEVPPRRATASTSRGNSSG